MSDEFPSENELYERQPVQSPKVITQEDKIVNIYDLDGNTKTVLRVGGEDGTTNPVGVQHPVPTDGDSVYVKDLWIDESVVSGWVDADGTGEDLVTIPFSNLHTSINYPGADNPKTIRIHFNRTVNFFQVGIGCAAHPGENFSNVVIRVLGSGAVVRTVLDNSADSTKYTSKNYEFGPELGNAVDIEFHTADDVCISNITIQKVTNVAARLQAIKPDGTVTDIDATAGGNLKTSLEEFETTFYADPLPVADMMLLIARGLRVGMSKVNKYGKATDGIQTTPTDVWDRADSDATQQIWLAPTAARIHTVASSSAADDGTPEGAGVGAQAVRVWYLPDWDTKETFEDVVLNGLTGVAMLNAAVIIHRMKVIPVGVTYNINVGDICATAAVDGTITACVNAGEGQSQMAIYGIPSVQTGYMPNYDVNAHNTGNPSTVIETEFTMMVNEHPDLNTTTFLGKSNMGLIASGTTHVHKQYSPYKTIPGPAIIKFQAIATAADTEATAEFDLILVDN